MRAVDCARGSVSIRSPPCGMQSRRRRGSDRWRMRQLSREWELSSEPPRAVCCEIRHRLECSVDGRIDQTFALRREDKNWPNRGKRREGRRRWESELARPVPTGRSWGTLANGPQRTLWIEVSCWTLSQSFDSDVEAGSRGWRKHWLTDFPKMREN